ncbi:acetylcholinesterase 2 precursor, partial [Blyttiomyces helicus]
GSANTDAFDASNLSVSLNAIVITINYRLSVFGFFDSLGAANATKTSPLVNFGILDQRLALHWALDNAAAFGGDTKRLTLIGQSSGAQSVLIHLAHPDTQPYVRSVVLMS